MGSQSKLKISSSSWFKFLNFGSSKRSYSENPIKDSWAHHGFDFHKVKFSFILDKTGKKSLKSSQKKSGINWDEKGIIFSRESMKNSKTRHTPLHDCKMKNRQITNLKE